VKNISKLFSLFMISSIGVSSLSYGVDASQQQLPNYQASRQYSKGMTVTRDYNAPLTAANIKDINYILTMLGFSSLVKVMKSKSSIEKAGNRIETVHPFRFLQSIFTSEELTVAANNIKEKGWAWKDFVGGFKKSLSEESKRQNLKPEYIQDFANNLGIDASQITPAIQQGRWEDFINTLLILKPRQSNDQNRYNI